MLDSRGCKQQHDWLVAEYKREAVTLDPCCSPLCPPGGVIVPGLPAGLPDFHGCIRQATINRRPAMLSRPLAVHGAVGTQGCPHM